MMEGETQYEAKDAQILAKAWKLDERIVNQFQSMNIQQFFPIQQRVIPTLLTHNRDIDMCIAAPTGSGKTLVYVIPIIQRLLTRIICRLRALIVVPSRDLAIQVKRVVDHFCQNTPLKCGLAIGQVNFAAEQKILVGKSGTVVDQLLALPGSEQMTPPAGGESQVDILVATPGRLVDHIEQTPGFTLQHLTFLVVDEVDRLLNQSYQDWLTKIYADIYHKPAPTTQGRVLDPQTCRDTRESNTTTSLSVPLQKLVLSATLTRNPRKLASLGLKNPKFYGVGRVNTNSEAMEISTDLSSHLEAKKEEKLYSVPENLKEYLFECEPGEKPLVLLQLLQEFQGQQTIVFTSSVNSTHRLCRLLQLFGSQSEQGAIREYSSGLSQKQRSVLMAECRAGKVQVLVCSDAMARGMDIQSVENVVNYDVPTYIKTYIHRVGRTARAGREGRCVTLVKRGQVKALWKLLKKAENNYVKPYPLDREAMKALVPRYTECLARLKGVLDDEAAGALKTASSVAAIDLQKPVREATESSTSNLLSEQLARNLKRKDID